MTPNYEKRNLLKMKSGPCWRLFPCFCRIPIEDSLEVIIASIRKDIAPKDADDVFQSFSAN